MYTNSDITIYHFDKQKQLYTKQYIQFVMWHSTASIGTHEGYENANNVTVRIPKAQNDLSSVLIEVGDILVKGNAHKDITKKSDLNGLKNVFTITSVVDNNDGSSNMHHVHIVGK